MFSMRFSYQRLYSFAGRVSMHITLYFHHAILVRFRLLSGHLFLKKLLTPLTTCSLCIVTLCTFSYFSFWF